ncbi:MAG: TatD family hydrolase [Actinomycetaceae bacterium]|nr:TatD family hydrolase [Actinomycetaceae bacterium]
MGKSKRKRGWPAPGVPLPAPIIDNHCHLPIHEGEIPSPEGQKVDLQTQLEHARVAGVEAIITVGCELPSLEPSLALAQNNPQVWAALAIHPNEAPLHLGIVEKSPDGMTWRLQDHHTVSLEEALGRVADLARNGEVVAIGETGLDYFRTADAGRTAQKDSFRAHIALAKELDLPLQIHDRDAHADTIAVLLSEGAPARTVFHCFSGDAEMAEILRENGWYASFAGPVTYPANAHLRQALQALPRELVLVETDAPYLTAQAHRGQPNASYLMPYTVRRIAAEWLCASGAYQPIIDPYPGNPEGDPARALADAWDGGSTDYEDALVAACHTLRTTTGAVYGI